MKYYLLGFISFFLILNNTQAEIYKWVDHQGKTHYSDTKQPEIKQELVQLQIKKSSFKKLNIQINDVNHVLNKEDNARIINDVNAVYQFFNEQLHFLIYKTVPVSIKLFKNKADYLNYLATITQQAMHNSRGVYIRRSNEIVLWLNPNRELTFWTIKHETSHAIVDTLTPYTPSWLNEGLAENMESIAYQKGSFLFTPHPENFFLMQQNIQQNRNLPIRELLSMTSSNWKQSNLYPQSAELVRMLLSKKTGINFISRIIHKFERGDRTLSHIHAEKHYIGGLSILQIDWNNWLKKTKPEPIFIKK